MKVWVTDGWWEQRRDDIDHVLKKKNRLGEWKTNSVWNVSMMLSLKTLGASRRSLRSVDLMRRDLMTIINIWGAWGRGRWLWQEWIKHILRGRESDRFSWKRVENYKWLNIVILCLKSCTEIRAVLSFFPISQHRPRKDPPLYTDLD